MNAPRLYTPEAIAIFLAMCRAGQPRDVIAARLGWTVRQIADFHQHLKRHGRQRYRLPYRSRRKLRSQLIGRESEIAELSRNDHSAAAIGELLGVTRSTAANFMDRHGLFAPHRRRRRGLLPVSLRALAKPAVVIDADVRLAERMWAMVEDVA